MLLRHPSALAAVCRRAAAGQAWAAAAVLRLAVEDAGKTAIVRCLAQVGTLGPKLREAVSSLRGS